MPALLRLLCIAFAALLVLHAGLAPLIEEGYWFILPLAIDGSFLWLLWLFYRRTKGTISWLSTICVVGVVMNLLFLPLAEEYGRFAPLVTAQWLAEAVVLFALYFVLKTPSAKAWFDGTIE